VLDGVPKYSLCRDTDTSDVCLIGLHQPGPVSYLPELYCVLLVGLSTYCRDRSDHYTPRVAAACAAACPLLLISRCRPLRSLLTATSPLVPRARTGRPCTCAPPWAHHCASAHRSCRASSSGQSDQQRQQQQQRESSSWLGQGQVAGAAGAAAAATWGGGRVCVHAFRESSVCPVCGTGLATRMRECAKCLCVHR
jgi:hypothetical protein